MEISKKILNFCIAFSLVCLSLSALIYSVKDSKATAAPAPMPGNNGYEVAGVANVTVNDYIVLGYNRTTGDMKILARKRLRDLTND